VFNSISSDAPPASELPIPLGLDDVHIWVVSFGAFAERASVFERFLSSLELKESEQFHFAIHRDRFLIRRGLLRIILAAYLKTRANDIIFQFEQNGKPALSGRFRASEITFSVSHSGDVAVFAITQKRAIGVDIEQLHHIDGVNTIVNQFFSSQECKRFDELPIEDRIVSFFNLWTRKEAWLKATGESLPDLLNMVEASFIPEEPVRLLSVPGGEKLLLSWSLHEIQPWPNYVGAICSYSADASVVKIKHFDTGEALLSRQFKF
jgi:4'-phosphopantetheinyl transferase